MVENLETLSREEEINASVAYWTKGNKLMGDVINAVFHLRWNGSAPLQWYTDTDNPPVRTYEEYIRYKFLRSNTVHGSACAEAVIKASNPELVQKFNEADASMRALI